MQTVAVLLAAGGMDGRKFDSLPNSTELLPGGSASGWLVSVNQVPSLKLWVVDKGNLSGK
jgi:hypothetical protein